MVRVMLCVLFVLLTGVVATGDAAEKARPVTKVINMLKDMVEQMEREGEEDEEIYEALGCWCTTNDKAKTKAIADGESSISELSSAIEELSAKSSRLNTEIAMLDKEVAKNEEALGSATALREKQLAEFTVEEKDMVSSITSLKGAVIALSKHHGAAFLQVSQSARDERTMSSIAAIHHELRHHGALLTAHQRKALSAFVDAPDRYFRSERVVLLQEDQREPQSGEIFGILKAMKESFEMNLDSSQKEEGENVAAYEDLKAAKEKEIEAGKDLSETKTQELAATDEKNAQSKQGLEDARSTLAADIEFLTNLKDKCQNIDHEFEERTKTRQLEIQATSKALAYLSSDEAHALFTRTFNPALLQTSSSARAAEKLQRAEGARAAGVLVGASRRVPDPRLSTLALAMKAPTGTAAAFDAVKKQVQGLVESLQEEKAKEIKLKDFCIDEFNSNARHTTSKTRDKADLLAKIEDLKMSIDLLIKEIEDLVKQIKEAEVQLKRAGQDREKQNKEFQVVLSDQRATQKLLKVALSVLKGVYAAALVQTDASTTITRSGLAAPPGFKSYEKNAAAGGVMGMMQSIIDDAKTLEDEAVRGEKESQEAYEEFVAETNALIDSMNKDKTNKTEDKGKAEADQIQAETELEGVEGELDVLAAEVADLHNECDYTLKNFEVRQTARDDEMDALKQALAIFSGASFSAFIEKSMH